MWQTPHAARWPLTWPVARSMRSGETRVKPGLVNSAGSYVVIGDDAPPAGGHVVELADSLEAIEEGNTEGGQAEGLLFAYTRQDNLAQHRYRLVEVVEVAKSLKARLEA